MIPKTINLRAFRIANNNIAKSYSGIKNILSTKLNGSVAQDRRMLINRDDEEEDLVSDFNSNANCVYGVILRISPTKNVPNIPDDYLKKEKITITELNSVELGTTNIYKHHYYFSLSDKFLVTNLQGNLPITRLQTYINWFLEKERGTELFEFTPVITEPKETKLSDLKNIVVRDSKIHKDVISQNEESFGKKLLTISNSLLSTFISDSETLKQIEENQIISAQLLIKFSKPKNMSKKDYEKALGAFLKPVSETDDISFTPKKGNKIRGTDLLKVKPVEIELTDSGKISENQLQQEMEKFLQELQNEDSN